MHTQKFHLLSVACQKYFWPFLTPKNMTCPAWPPDWKPIAYIDMAVLDHAPKALCEDLSLNCVAWGNTEALNDTTFIVKTAALQDEFAQGEEDKGQSSKEALLKRTQWWNFGRYHCWYTTSMQVCQCTNFMPVGFLIKSNPSQWNPHLWAKQNWFWTWYHRFKSQDGLSYWLLLRGGLLVQSSQWHTLWHYLCGSKLVCQEKKRACSKKESYMTAMSTECKFLYYAVWL